MDETQRYNREWYLKHKKAQQEKARQYYYDHRDKILLRSKERRKDPEFIKLRQMWYTENIEEIRTKRQAYREAHRHMFIAYQNNRRTKTGEMRGIYVLDLLEAQGGKCIYCGKDISVKHTVDHKIPVSKGGSNEKGNLQLLCKPCNSKKNVMTDEEYRNKLKLLNDGK